MPLLPMRCHAALVLSLWAVVRGIRADRRDINVETHDGLMAGGAPPRQAYDPFAQFTTHWDPAVQRAGQLLRYASRILEGAKPGEEERAAELAGGHLARVRHEIDGLISRRQQLHLRGHGAGPAGPGSLQQSYEISGTSLKIRAQGAGGAASVMGPDANATAGGAKGAAGSLDGAEVQPEDAEAADPRAEALERVSEWAAEIAGSAEDGAAARLELQADPANAASILRKLATIRRIASDGVDRDEQAWQHLLELFFFSRSSQLHIPFTGDTLQQLAQDYTTISALKKMSTRQLRKLRPGDGYEGFVSYLRGRAPRSRNRSAASGRRVLLFSCSFGDGHRSAAAAVKDYLEMDGFEVKIVDTTKDPRFKRPGSAKVFEALGIPTNYMFNELVLKMQFYKLYNMFDELGMLVFGQLVQPCPAPTCNTELKDTFRSFILEENPDMVITVYHMELVPILEVSKDLGNLPVLHVATDMDLKMNEVFGRLGPAAIYKRFLVSVPFNVPESLKTIKPLSANMTTISGFPVRLPFLQGNSIDKIEKERKRLVPAGTKVVLVMTGGVGQDVPWPELLAAQGFDCPLHIVIIAGRNKVAARRLPLSLTGRAVFPDGRQVLQGDARNVTVEVIHDPSNHDAEKPDYVLPGYLSLLMDVADAIITKPGGSTTGEIAYRGVPALFDATVDLLHWEEFTVKIFEQYSRGLRFTTPDGLVESLVATLALGRNSSLAMDPASPGGNSALLDTGARLRVAARRLLATECSHCPVFPS